MVTSASRKAGLSLLARLALPMVLALVLTSLPMKPAHVPHHNHHDHHHSHDIELFDEISASWDTESEGDQNTHQDDGSHDLSHQGNHDHHSKMMVRRWRPLLVVASDKILFTAVDDLQPRLQVLDLERPPRLIET